MIWPWTRRKRLNQDVEEARRSRMAAEIQYAREEVQTIRPLREMYRENHIGPLLNNLVQRRVERGRDDSGPAGA